MPNEVSNRITITHESEIDQILQEIHKEIPNVTILQKSKRGIRIEYRSAWEPNVSFLEKIMNHYPLSWVKNEWISEDGTSGIFIGNKNNIKSMKWDDLSIDEENHFFNT
jgi:hypothetical protein